jgi:hypothetical protein
MQPAPGLDCGSRGAAPQRKIGPVLRGLVPAAVFFVSSAPDQFVARYRRSSGIVSPALRSLREATLMETVRCGSANSFSKLEHPAGQG